MVCGLVGVAALCSLVLAAPAPDLVFHAPEVLVRHAASSKAVGTGRAHRNHSAAAAMGGAAGGAGGAAGPVYEEFFIEHDVSTASAKSAARALNVSLIPETLPGCHGCSRAELEYCESRILWDHCCCERRYLPEPFPYLPHSCYAGAAACAPLAASCAHYTRIRDCCCARRMADKWKGILSSSHRVQASMSSLLLLTSLAALHL